MSVPFLGEEFDVPAKINTRRLLRMAKFASSGADSDSLAAMGALDDLITQCVRPEDAERFDKLCDEHGASAEQLFQFTAAVIGAIGEVGPTQQAVSSDGPTPDPESSASRLEELALERWSGRPDLMIAATRSA